MNLNEQKYLINCFPQSSIKIIAKSNVTNNLITHGFTSKISGDPDCQYIGQIFEGQKSDGRSIYSNRYNITVNFNEIFESCESMFENKINIIEIDLSNFDFSKVTSIRRMFYNSRVTKINFGNINTSVLENMEELFSGCSSLSAINLTKFDTSKVKNMNGMFNGCSKLKELDLSLFITSSVTTINSMFHSCSSLLSLNIYQFKFNNSVDKDQAFEGIISKVKYCIKDIKTKNYLDLNFSEIYVYQKHCYSECPSNTYHIFYDENESEENVRECFDEIPYGYYLDKNNGVYKECYETCATCITGGNITNNNCEECRYNYSFYINPKNISNCYETCNKYYYFNEFNNFNCTEEYSGQYNKLIINKSQCIDECKNDDIYRYEYNNICYKNCPNYTIQDETNYTCKDYLNLEYSTNNNNINEKFTGKLYENYTEKIYEKLTENINKKFTENINEKLTENINEKSTNNINEKKNEYLNKILEEIVRDNINNSNKEIQDQVFEKIRDIFNNGFDTTDIDKGNDFTYNIKNIIYTITTTLNEKNNEDKDKSSINLGECEDKLKEKYNISQNDSLYLFKIDALIENVYKVEYEVYYNFTSNNFTKLNLSVCSNITIDISIPLDISLDDLDKYNMSSGLYNDICYTLTSEKGTDKTLKDRQNDFKKNNISVCEEDCIFSDYNNRTKKAICSCYTKIELPVVSTIKVDKKKLFDNFKHINNIGNFVMLKCIHLLFDLNNIFKNTANYMMFILFLLSKIALFIFMCYNNMKIKDYINQFSKKDIKDNNNIKNNNKKKNENNKIKNNGANKNKIINNTKKNEKNNKPKKDGKNTIIKINVNSINNNLTSIKNEDNNKREFKQKYKKSKGKEKGKIYKKIDLKNNDNSNNLLRNNNNIITKKINLKLNKTNKIKNKIITYNDIEMNSFDYEDAKEKDNRTYCQYYVSLLKTKHILIFSFFLLSDYNPQITKIYIFFFIFAINYLVSAMFYTDEVIHKIDEDEGSFDITYQLPIMLYSLIISTVLKIALNASGLYEQNIIEYKNDKKKEINPTKLMCKIRCKVVLFFLITDLFLFFFWVYLGCFCAVYKNTQIHLLIDVSSSFGISFITPFFIYLLPGIFRIPSLDKKSNRSCMYKFSKILQLF